MSSLQFSLPMPSALILRRERCAEFALGALYLMILVGLAPLSEKVKTIPATGDGDVGRQLVYGLTFGFLFLTSGVIEHPRKLLVVPVGLSVLLAYCCVTVTWSVEPSVAARRLALTILIVWTIFKAVELAGYERTIATIRILLVVALALNYVAVAFSPVGRHLAVVAGDPGLVGDWRGVLPQKNFAGAVCAFTIMIFTLDAREIRLAVRIPVLLATTYFLYRTHSKTSVALMALCVLIGWAFRHYNPRYRALMVPLGLALAGLAGLAAAFAGDRLLAPFTGQDALTGRGSIWPVLIGYAQDHWMTGAGYGSFWNIGPNSPVGHYTKSWVSGIASGHNGYIDLLTQIGYPGLVLAVLATIVLPLLHLLVSLRIDRSQASLLLAFLVFCAGHNMTESSLLDRDMIVEVFLMTTIALIGTATRAAPPRLSAGRTMIAPPPARATWTRPKEA